MLLYRVASPLQKWKQRKEETWGVFPVFTLFKGPIAHWGIGGESRTKVIIALHCISTMNDHKFKSKTKLLGMGIEHDILKCLVVGLLLGRWERPSVTIVILSTLQKMQSRYEGGAKWTVASGGKIE